MKLGPIDSSRIEAMAAKLQAAAARTAPATTGFSSTLAAKASTPVAGATPGVAGLAAVSRANGANESTKVSFSGALKQMLETANEQQMKADGLSKRFAMGDDSVNLSDVMIERQKASLSLQATVQVRNKLVSAYHEIMNMQV